MLCPGHMVLEDNDPYNVTVTMGEGTGEHEYEAEVLPKPEDVNVVFLKLKSDTPLNLPVVRFASKAPALGAPLAYLGIMGDSFDFAKNAIPTQVISTIDTPRKYYALGLAVRFGVVGAPVIDETGAAIGVVGFDLSRQEGGDLYLRSGQPLLYQTDLFAKYITTPPVQQEKKQVGGEAWLGVFTQPLTEELAEYWGLKIDGGLVVSTVVPASPAAGMGLQPGDIITSFNNTSLHAKLDRDVLTFTKLVREAGPGKTVKVLYLRNGEKREAECTLAERPRSARDAEEYEDNVLGLTVRELTTDVRIALNLAQDAQGVIVRKVKSGSPAQQGKIGPGVIVMAIGQQKVTSLEEYKAVMARLSQDKPTEISVFARVGANTGFFRVSLRWDNR